MGKFRDQNRHKWTKRPSQKPKEDKPRNWKMIWILVAFAVGVLALLSCSEASSNNVPRCRTASYIGASLKLYECQVTPTTVCYTVGSSGFLECIKSRRVL